VFCRASNPPIDAVSRSFQQGKANVVIAQQTGHESMNALGDKSPTAGLL
jgi:hypothetical protein